MKAGHHGHAFCGPPCVPHWLHEEFLAMLGHHDFDLLVWYPKRDVQRQKDGDAFEDGLAWWRDALRAELRARGWIRPRARLHFPSDAPHTTPGGLIYPCPHMPPCASTWSCGRKQQEERDHDGT